MINGAMNHTNAMFPSAEAQLAAHEARIDGVEKQQDEIVRKLDKLTWLVIVGLAELAFQLALRLTGK